jgi:putative ABC transport system permease protein
MGTLFQDIRYSLRTLRKAPGFAVVVILTLALGIGANTAIFSIVDGVLLRPLPFPHPERLVRIVDDAPGAGLHDIGMSVPELRDLQERSGLFDDVSAELSADMNITGAGHPERGELLGVSPNYFSLLGVPAQIGRVFGPEDKAEGFSETVVISDGFWRRTFGGNPAALGQRIRLDNDAYTIVGVAPPGFRHPGRTVATDVDVWAATGFAADPFPAPRRTALITRGAIARLRAGISIQEAQARLDGFTTQLRAQYPNDYRPEQRFTIRMEPLKDSLTGNVRPMLLTLLAAVAMMLLIGCSNIANLLLARAAGRQREIALRQSLGATRGRLARQMLTESVLLAVLAGGVGMAGAAWALQLLLYLIPSKLPRLAEIAIDGRVLLFACGVSVITGVLFGLAPAFQVSGFDLAAYLKEGARSAGSGRRQNRASAALVAGEFAVCLMLMIGAGLLVRSFWKLTEVDPGFNPQNTMVARIWLPVPNDPKQNPYPKVADRAALAREVLRRVQALPGVTSAAMSTSVPLSRGGAPASVSVKGRPADANGNSLAEIIGVSPDFFRTLETPLYQGRFFTESDQIGSQLNVLVDRTTARQFWPGESPVGKRVKLGGPQSNNPWAVVVGMVGDIRNDAIDRASAPHIYFSLYQFNSNTLGVEVRGGTDTARLGEMLRHEIQAVDPGLPVFGIRTFSSMVSDSVVPHRFSAQLMGAFAALALLLAAVGIYGVLAYFVGQRRREIGVRMALGAKAGPVVRLVMLEGLRPIAVGMAIGLAGSLVLNRLLAELVYGVSTSDPVVFTAVALFLTAAALLASYIPAWQATRIDPMEALRAD